MDWTRGRIIGRGSCATVYLAADGITGEVVAVKSTGLSKSEYLRREAEILYSLNSPFIVAYKGCETTKEPHGEAIYNLLMEYAPKGTLADKPRLDEPKIVYYTRQILQGISYIQSEQIVHCDIKGSNILIGEDNNAKIGDFGCAKRVRYSGPDPAEPVRGTPAYMSPEVARGEHQGFECDIWALGCTIIEMATGLPPWVRDNQTDPVSLLYQVGFSGGLPDFPGFLSEQAKDFLDKCLRRDPRERWTANQLLKHPFLAENKLFEDEIWFEKSTCSISGSPTSVIDQLFWRSLEEGSVSLEDLDRPIRGRTACERIGRLGLVSGGPGWSSDDESWTTVRDGSGSICDDVEARESNLRVNT